jgi:hypothetical protein
MVLRSCTVLDFVGNSRDEYDFSQKFRALVGKTNQSIKDEITNDFPHLPLGCRIELEEQTQAMILRNISRATMNASRLRQLINNFEHQSTLTLTLANFLRFNPNVNLEDIYKLKMSWLELVESANKNQINEPNLDTSLAKAYYRVINHHLLTCSSLSYLQFLKQLIIDNFRFEDMDATQCQFALMCHYNFWDKPGAELGFTSLKQSLAALRHAQLQSELLDVISLLIERIHHSELEMHIPAISSLKVHSRYTREQILAASGASSFGKKSTAREGVLVLKALNIELLFVTLKKSVKQFSPTTMYHDYAINELLFHWQSQNSARPGYGRGLGYTEHEKMGRKLILFVREQAKDENGRTMGFVNFGEVVYMAHTGAQPMNITWKLMSPMPDAMWHEAAKLAVG